LAGQSQGFAQQNQQAQTNLTRQQSDMFRQQLSGMKLMQDALAGQAGAPIPTSSPQVSAQSSPMGVPSVADASGPGVDTSQPGWYLRPGAVAPTSAPAAMPPQAAPMMGPRPIVDPALAARMATIGAAYGDKNYGSWLDFAKAAPGFQFMQGGDQRFVPGGSADPTTLARQKFAEATGTKSGELPYSVTEIKPGAAGIPTASILGQTPDPFGLRSYSPLLSGGTAPGAPPAPSAAPTAGPAPSIGGSAPVAGSPGGGVQRLGTGGFMNTSSPALINLTQGQTPAYNEAVGKDIAKFIADKQAAIPGAQQSLKAVGELRQALDGLPTGPGTESINDASSFMQKFGIDLNKVLPAGWQTDPTKSAVALKNITQLAAAYAKGEFPTRITNNDMAIALQATPNFWNNPAANKQLLDNLEAVQRVKLEEARFYRQAAGQFPAGTSPDWSIIDKWDTHLQNLQGVPDAIKRSWMSYSELNANPNMGGDHQMALPQGAVNYASGPNGQKGFVYPKDGGGFYVGDETGKALR
jgi:hypothetical protein